MILVALHDPALQLEACNSCSVVWFDAPSFELLPQIGFESTNALSMQSTDVLAAMRLKDFNAKQQAEDQAERKKKRLGRFFGGKRKSDEPPQS